MTPTVSSELFRLDATELVRRLTARKLSCVELMEATLQRIDALNPTFNAIVAQRPREACLAEARANDSGPASGALFGLPLAVKDLAAVKGIPMTMGSPLLERFMPSADSIFVERLRAAGAIIIGKTNPPNSASAPRPTIPSMAQPATPTIPR
jgi:amidase